MSEPPRSQLQAGHGIAGIQANRQSGGPIGGWYQVTAECECGALGSVERVMLSDITEKALAAWFGHYGEVLSGA
jgi:hypothetical protein